MIKKQIPNLFTLLNLFFGCIAIVYITMPGIMITVGADGENLIEIPQQIYISLHLHLHLIQHNLQDLHLLYLIFIYVLMIAQFRVLEITTH